MSWKAQLGVETMASRSGPLALAGYWHGQFPCRVWPLAIGWVDADATS